MDLPATLVSFSSTHAAAFLPFSDDPSRDVRPEYIPQQYTSADSFIRSGPRDLVVHMFNISAPQLKPVHGVKQALSTPEAVQWQEAMDAEVAGLAADNKMVPGHLPSGTKGLTTLFVFSRPFKPDPSAPSGTRQIFKTRLRANGKQTYGYLPWETTCTTPQLYAFRLAFIFGSIFSLKMSHFDVSQAFMNAKLDVPVWVSFPAGYTYQGFGGALLHYALYGLKVAGASWQRLVKVFMLSFMFGEVTFRQSSHDDCIYFIYTDLVKVMCVVYVDDFILVASTELEDAFWAAFRARFLAKHLGEVTSVLQMRVRQDQIGIYLCQSRQIKDLMANNNITAHSYRTFMDPKLIIKKPADPDLSLVPSYRSILGSLLWLARGSRPDCYYPVIYLAQFVSCPSEESMKALIRIAQYMDSTAHYSLAFYYPETPVKVITMFCYSDAGLARDLENDARSYSGSVIFLAGMILQWHSGRQTITEVSSTGSEYVAASTAAQRLVSLMFMLTEIFGSITHRIDSQQPLDSDLDHAIQYLDRAATDIHFDMPSLQTTSVLRRLLEKQNKPADGLTSVRPNSPTIPDELSTDEITPLRFQNNRNREYISTASAQPRLELPIPLLLDNDACRSIVEHHLLSEKVKHVIIRFHVLRDFVRLNWIRCARVPSARNLADPYTKPVPPVKDMQPYFIQMFQQYMAMGKAQAAVIQK
ncbi:hypothetical protein CYMTET_18877 [Cymbomonas tetramitiformis]|uniref:Reverse transcriptase Ty1/copia-type domain-containing protein n=1 Tax=Cymbomonas tetramitiformis TaxID=36881 RepID=A0AAE0G743_9CHLO|nr:hypothetical protein CYMTET_18877 [Cymbomonas tetramitiformis]